MKVKHLLGIAAAAALGSVLAVFPASAAMETLELPLEFYRYSFSAQPRMNSSLDSRELEMLVKGANEIWAQAGIRWSLSGVSVRTISAQDFPALTGGETRAEIKQRLLKAAPGGLGGKVWKAALIRDFGVQGGGLYIPEAGSIYLAEYPGGEKTRPALLAHELGHALGLPHNTTDNGNLMKGSSRMGPLSETDTLNARQIAAVRAQALKGPFPKPESGRSGGNRSQSGKRHSGSGLDGGAGATRSRLKSFDLDGDGTVELKDVPERRRRTLSGFDVNRDGRLDPEEMAGIGSRN